MGYSYRKDAGDSLDLIIAAKNDLADLSSNSWHNDSGCHCFYETGRENADGAITGTIWKETTKGSGVGFTHSFRIAGNGKVIRFPHANKSQRAVIKLINEKLADKEAQTIVNLSNNFPGIKTNFITL